MKKNRILFQIGLPVLLLLAAALLFVLSRAGSAGHRDLQKLLASGSYDAAFFSMFPIDTFKEEDFAAYGGWKLIKSEVQGYPALKKSMELLQASQPGVRFIYLGIDPERITAQQTRELIDLFPGVNFEILPACLSLQSWRSRPDYESTFRAYRAFVTDLADDHRPIHIYPFFAQEWLIADPENYRAETDNSQKSDTETLLNEQIALRLYLYTLDCLSERSYHIREREIDPLFEEFHALLADAASGAGPSFPDLSDWDILFFGDSIFGNYSGHYSIPGYVADFSGANTYNCGWSGSTASGVGGFSISGMLDSYFAKDPSPIPQTLQTYRELSRLIEDQKIGGVNRPNRLYVLYYGLNDYFTGQPVDSADPLDPTSYGGALRHAVETLHQKDPGAKIILSLPNFTTFYDNGTQIQSEVGGVYYDYVQTVRKVADEYHLPVIDIYHEVITPTDHLRFLSGDVHPNEFGEYRIAKALMQCIADHFSASFSLSPPKLIFSRITY